MFKKKSILFRFFVSYLCLLLPILLISFVIAQSTVSKMKADLDSSIAYQLKRISNELDNQYINYRNSSAALFSTPELLPNKMLSSYINAAYGIDILKYVCSFNTDIQNVFMLYGKEQVYSAQGVSGKKVMFERTLDCTDESTESGLAIIESENNVTSFLRTKTNGGYLFLHFSNRIGTISNNVSVNYCVSLPSLQKIVEPLTDNNTAYVNVIFDGGDTLHFYGNAAEGLNIIKDSQYPAENRLKEYTTAARSADMMGITVEVLYQSDMLYKDISSSQMLNYIIIACGLLVSMVISFLMSRRRYTHIEQLASSFSRPTAIPGNKEYDYIQRMIQRVVHECDDWEHIAKNSTSILKQQTAEMLFHGLIKEPKAIEQILNICGLELYEEHFFIGGIIMNGDDKVYSRFEQVMDGDLFCETTINGQRAILFLSEIPNPDYLRKTRIKTAEQLSQVLEDLGGNHIHVGLSQVYQSLSMASYAYMEAVSTLECIQNDSKAQRFECWESIIKVEKVTLQLDQDQIEEFTKSLEKRGLSRAERSLAQMNKAIALQLGSDENRRYLRYCILQPLILALKNSELDEDHNLLDAAIKINPADGIEFEKSVKKVLQGYCKNIDRNYDFEKIVKYIEGNYSNFDLSLEKVAGYAGLTKNYLSKLFKERTGNCYIDYLSRMRMEKAKEFLTETNLSIKEIVQKVGYIDESSFRKKFKAEYGINASEHRRHKNQIKADEENKDER